MKEGAQELPGMACRERTTSWCDAFEAVDAERVERFTGRRSNLPVHLFVEGFVNGPNQGVPLVSN
jgi:hypothetical protein